MEKEEVLKICADILGGQWTNIKLEDFQFSRITGGFANKLYYCGLSEKLRKKVEYEPTEVVFRFYGSQAMVTEGESVLKTLGIVGETLNFYILGQQNLAPKLYGIFNKGRIEEYIQSDNVSVEECTSVKMMGIIARRLAKFHTLNMPFQKTIPYVSSFIKKVSVISKNKELIVPIENFDESEREGVKFVRNIDIQKEWSDVKKWLEKHNSRIVFCHNDSQRLNIVRRKDRMDGDDDQIMLLDYETNCYNYRGFDIAYFFRMMRFDPALISKQRDPNAKLYPDDDEQRIFIKEYVKEWKKISEDKFIEEMDNEEYLFKECKIFRIVVLIYVFGFFVLWSTNNNAPFPMARASILWKDYENLKQELLSKYPDLVQQEE